MLKTDWPDCAVSHARRPAVVSDSRTPGAWIIFAVQALSAGLLIMHLYLPKTHGSLPVSGLIGSMRMIAAPAPAIGLAASGRFPSPSAGNTVNEFGLSGDEPVNEKILVYERYIATHPGEFSWTAHNELRHLYQVGLGDETKAIEHADILLASSLCDDYILRVLSDWRGGQEPRLAAAKLLYLSRRYPQFAHLVAACKIGAADHLARAGDSKRAAQLYESVARTGEPSLAGYRQLALARLESML